MKKIIALLLITFLGLILRLYQIVNVPPSLDWDEVSLGWNAYSILKTGTDEFGVAHPLMIRSFNDYKPAGYVYSLIPFLVVFGKTDFAVRLPSVLAGALAVPILYFLILDLLTIFKWKSNKTKISLLSTLFLSISPWSIQFSRGAFEANVALTATLLGIFLINRYVLRTRFLYLMLGVTSLFVSFYTYHSAKVFVPLIIIIFVVFFWKNFWNAKKAALTAVLLMLIFIAPTIKSTFGDSNGVGSRFSGVSVFSSTNLVSEKEALDHKKSLDQLVGNKIGVINDSRNLFYIRQIFQNYLSHFDINFLFIKGDDNNRHHAPNVGLNYLWQLPLILFGLVQIWKGTKRLAVFLSAWLLVAPLASSVAVAAPHAIRSLPMLPVLCLLSAIGLMEILKSVQRKYLIILPALFFIFVGNFFYFHQYFAHYPKENSSDWQYGYKQMVEKVLRLSKGYSEVNVTNVYDQPYIYFLWYGNFSPEIKNDGTFGIAIEKFHFVDFRIMTAEQKEKLSNKKLYIKGKGDNLDFVNVIEKVYDFSGESVFEIGKVR